MRVIVVGSGIAGLVAAIRAAREHEVLLVTKGALQEGSTRHAQGGIAAALFDGDSVEAHIEDTLAAGAGLGDPEAVRVLCEEGPQRVRDLIAFGVDFDRDPSGALARGLEAAHSAARILHAGGDATGAAIEAALTAAVRGTAVAILEHAMLVDLVLGPPAAPPGGRPAPSGPLRGLPEASGPPADARAGASPSETQDSVHPMTASPRPAAGPSRHVPAFPDAGTASARRVTGVELLVDGGRRIERADAVILASGGAGRLYPHTTNPAVATGDGVAAAWRAGAELADLEFVQFHPTALASGFLVSEAVRGEGAVLRDAAGRRYMTSIDPRAELAPRDVVARATAAVMAGQDGRPVLLDATAVPDLALRFPSIDAHLRGLGIDWTREPVPVTPAAHYTMGGVTVDLRGRTSVPGLLAVGEVARTGVHGANRLASNSLLESLVFAWRAADALDAAPTPGAPSAPDTPSAQNPSGALGAPDTSEAQAPSGRTAEEPAPPRAARRSVPAFPAGAHRFVPVFPEAAERGPSARVVGRAEIQELAWRDLGLVRDGAALAAATRILAGWRVDGAEAHDLENRNLLDLARLVASAALARTASVGAHHRSDDPLTATAGAARLESVPA